MSPRRTESRRTYRELGAVLSDLKFASMMLHNVRIFLPTDLENYYHWDIELRNIEKQLADTITLLEDYGTRFYDNVVKKERKGECGN